MRNYDIIFFEDFLGRLSVLDSVLDFLEVSRVLSNLEIGGNASNRDQSEDVQLIVVDADLL
jgi:hypothetical protein